MKNIGAWLIDYAYMIKGGIGMYAHRNPPKHYLGYVLEDKNPVILIPGVFWRWGFLKQLGDRISLQGHPVYIVQKLGNNLKTISDSAALVREIIDENNLRNVVLIAHSKGGIIGKYLMVHLNSDQKVKGMISVATPYSGSLMSKLLPIRAVKGELNVDSSVIRDLSSHKDVNPKIISISPVFDNHVWSKEGSFLKGAKNITVNVKGHHKIVFSKEVEDLTFQYLKQFSNGAK